MKKSNYHFEAVIAVAVAGTIIATAYSARAANPSDKDKQFLAGYQKVHAALVAEDLSGAKKAAHDLGEEGGDIAKAGSINEARVGFEKLSSHAKTLIAGHSGY